MSKQSTIQKFAVSLYTQVRVKVVGVEAGNMDEAIEKADGAVDMHELFDRQVEGGVICDTNLPGIFVETLEWTEEAPEFYHVDVLGSDGEVAYEKSCWLGPDRRPLIEGKTTMELTVEKAELASMFMQELLDSVETLTGIADVYGARTLADLMYLQQAILTGGFIEHSSDESKVLDVIKDLPSGKKWVAFVQTDYMAGNVDNSHKVEAFTGFVNYDDIRLQADFQVREGASVAEKDAAFLAALAQQAHIDYLSLGVKS